MTPLAYFQKQSWKTGPHARSSRRRFTIGGGGIGYLPYAALPPAKLRAMESSTFWRGIPIFMHICFDEMKDSRMRLFHIICSNATTLGGARIYFNLWKKRYILWKLEKNFVKMQRQLTILVCMFLQKWFHNNVRIVGRSEYTCLSSVIYYPSSKWNKNHDL